MFCFHIYLKLRDWNSVIDVFMVFCLFLFVCCIFFKLNLWLEEKEILRPVLLFVNQGLR